MDRTLIGLGAALGFLGVAAGAFGAHGLRDRLSAESLAHWETGARYALIHALAAVVAGALVERLGRFAGAAGWCFVAGAVVFSGTLFAIALGGPRRLGAVTPVGGLLLLAGWAALAIAAWRSR